MADALIQHFGYFGIFLVLVLGGLGLPVPEEAPIILAAILVRKGTMLWPPALISCLSGVLIGDFIVFFLGYFYGEKVLGFKLTRKFLTKEREAQIKGYFHRHGVKILVLGRFAVGFRTAAYLTAGILQLPVLRLFLIDLCAATFSTLLMFGLGYAFASKVEEGFNDAKAYITPVIGLALAIWLLHRYIKGRLRAGKLVGPPVLITADDQPLPPDDLHAIHEPTPSPEAVAVEEAEVTVVVVCEEVVSAPVSPRIAERDCPEEAQVLPGSSLAPERLS
ncbi:DedA family protein [Tundrisphaera sp. TA3]|uniref:DedA family protein n=1 Tax=Tundrisphaera sp. TA3 TaxID=3435775 RepID=UPI003EBED8C0